MYDCKFCMLLLVLQVMYLYSYIHVFLLLCMFRSVYSVFIVLTGTLQLPSLLVFRDFSSVVRRIPGYK